MPSSLRIARQLLSRIEDEATGALKLKPLFVKPPPERLNQAKAAAKILGSEVWDKLPFAGKTKPMAKGNVEMILNRTWQPQLAITAIDGYPLPENGGNVLLPYTTLKLSLRLPPTCNGEAARKAVKAALEKNPPNSAKVTFDAPRGETGWNAPKLAPWLEAALNKPARLRSASPSPSWAKAARSPSWRCWARDSPQTQFVVTGVLGPHSNAHGPNEFLHIPTAKKVAASIASVLADHALQKR